MFIPETKSRRPTRSPRSPSPPSQPLFQPSAQTTTSTPLSQQLCLFPPTSTPPPHPPRQSRASARQPPTPPLLPLPPSNQPSVPRPTLSRTSGRLETKTVLTLRACGRVRALRTRTRRPAVKRVSRTPSAWPWNSTLTLAARCTLARNAASPSRSHTTSLVRRASLLRQAAGLSYSHERSYGHVETHGAHVLASSLV